MRSINFKKVLDIPIAIIDNFYSDEDYNKIIAELNYLYEIGAYKSPEDPDGPGTAYEDGVALKGAKGIHLDTAYESRDMSDILSINRQLFDKDLSVELIKNSPYFRYLSKCDKDYTKVHYYAQGDYYKPHTDQCAITAISWFYTKPRGFFGGEFIIEKQIQVDSLNNRMVIFPSILEHEVREVIMQENQPGKGRYSISQFLYM